MAGDYFPISVDLPRKREILALARATGRSRHEVIGLCIDFWAWAQHETADGIIRDVCVDGDIVTLVTVCGGDADFWKKMEEVGWLRVTGNTITIPHYDRWLSKGAKARHLNALRQQKYRKKQASLRNDSVTPNNALEKRI